MTTSTTIVERQGTDGMNCDEYSVGVRMCGVVVTVVVVHLKSIDGGEPGLVGLPEMVGE